MRKNLIEFFGKWPKHLKIWYGSALALLFFIGFVRAMQANNKYINSIDGTSEIISMFAAEHYADEGFFKNYLLPTYPPFGTDLAGINRSEPFVYNHYLAGQDLLLGMWVKVFGKHAYNFARLMPLLLTVWAVMFFTLVLGWYYKRPQLSCLLASLLLIPRSLVIWSICLFGHAYAMAFMMITLGFFFYFEKKSQGSKKIPAVIFPSFFFCGLAVMFFGVDWIPLTFISLIALAVLLGRKLDAFVQTALLAFFVGACSGMAYQLVVSSFYFGSFSAAIKDLSQWIGLRAEADFLVGSAKFGSNYIKHGHNEVFREFNKQAYGATGFTGVNLLALTLVFLFLSHEARAIPKKKFIAGVTSIFLAYIAAASWHVLMKTHAMGNLHYILRHYFILYLFFLVISLPLCFCLIEKARD